MEGVVVREMRHADLDQVLSIENVSFATPWPFISFEYEIKNNDAILKVAVIDDNIVGHVCIRSMLDITHVLDLAVLPALRRKGVGSMLLKDALRELRELRSDVQQITLEVRPSNSAAIRLYEKSGFKKTGSRRRYYRKPDEDAVIMSLDVYW